MSVFLARASRADVRVSCVLCPGLRFLELFLVVCERDGVIECVLCGGKHRSVGGTD